MQHSVWRHTSLRFCHTAHLAALGGALLAGLALPAPALAATEAPAGSVGGMGDVNLYPKRVVIDQRSRVASIGLFNRTGNTGDYDITITDMMMSPDGRLVDLTSVTDEAQRAQVKAASTMLRWSPHRVSLPPNEAQTVRIMSRIPPDLPPGEYRAHFTAVAVPADAGTGLSIESAVGSTKPDQIGVRIVPRFGISIPVILRVGETTLSTGFTGFGLTQLPDGRRAVAITITRQGTRSAFGDISIAVAGSKKPIAEIKGIGVYTEINQRAVQIPLDPATDMRLLAPGARVTVTYTDDDATPGKILARQEFAVP